MWQRGMAVALWVGLSLAACSSGDGDSSSCAMRTTGLSGQGPSCSNSLECGKTKWELSCDGAVSGNCVCSKNGVDEKTIPYSDSYCPADFSTADFDAYAAAAAKACGWP